MSKLFKHILRENVEVDKDFLKSFVMSAIQNPKKFYNLLLLSGMKSPDAYRIVFNLKYPRRTSASFATKMKMLHLLQNLIELITKDRLLYSRLRSLALSGELEHLGKNVTTLPYPKKSKSFKDVVENEGGMGLGNVSIDGVASGGEPDKNPPINPIMMMIRRAINSRRRKNKFNPVLYN